MPTTVSRVTIPMAATLAGCLQTGTLDDIRTLKIGKASRNTPVVGSLNLPGNGAITTAGRNTQSTSPVQYSPSDSRKMKVQDWRVVLFAQLTCPCCRQFAPALKAFSQRTGFDVFPINPDGKGNIEFPGMLPATPDAMVEYFRNDLPVTMPTTFLTNADTMETWPLLQGATKAGEFRNRFNKVLHMALDRQSRENIPFSTQGQ